MSLLLLFNQGAASPLPPLSTVSDGPFTLVAARSGVYAGLIGGARQVTLSLGSGRLDTLTAQAFFTTLTSNPGRKDTVYIADHEQTVEGR